MKEQSLSRAFLFLGVIASALTIQPPPPPPARHPQGGDSSLFFLHSPCQAIYQVAHSFFSLPLLSNLPSLSLTPFWLRLLFPVLGWGGNLQCIPLLLEALLPGDPSCLRSNDSEALSSPLPISEPRPLLLSAGSHTTPLPDTHQAPAHRPGPPGCPLLLHQQPGILPDSAPSCPGNLPAPTVLLLPPCTTHCSPLSDIPPGHDPEPLPYFEHPWCFYLHVLPQSNERPIFTV